MPIEFAPPAAGVQPFNITPVQYQDPLETLSRMQQMRTQSIQQQNAQIQQQQAQLGLQQAQQQMDSNRAFMNALVQGGGDTKKTRQLMVESGKVLPGSLMDFDKQVLERDTGLANLTEKQQTIRKNFADLYAGMITANGGPTDIGGLNAINNKARAQNVPEDFLQTRFPVPTQDHSVSDQFKAHANTILMQTQQEAEEKAQGEIEQQKATLAKTGLETTELAKKQLITDVRAAEKDPNNGLPTPAAWLAILQNPAYKSLNLPKQLTQKYLTDLQESQISEKDIPEYRIKQAEAEAIQRYAKMTPEQLDAEVDSVMPPADPMSAPTKAMVRRAAKAGDFPGVKQILKDAYDQRGRVQVAKETAQNKLQIDLSGYGQQLGAGMGGGPGGPAAGLSGEDYLKTLPAPLAARVKNIATGGDFLPTGRAAMSGPGAILTNAVYQYDPQYTPLLAQKRKEMLSDLTKTGPGTAGGNVVALNTMIHHADLYMETADALENGTFKPGNAIWNRVRDTFGKAPPTNAGLVAQFFAGETAKVAGEQTQGAVNELLDKMKTSNSPEQIRGAGQTLLGIAAGRMVPYKERIADAHLEGLAPPLIGPSAREILTRRGFDPETMQPAKAGGGGPQYLRQAVGRGGHVIGQTADGKWHDVQTGAVIQ